MPIDNPNDVISFDESNLPVLKDILDNIHNEALSKRDLTRGTVSFVIENRTSDPTAPVAGQIWFRTDL